MFEGASVVFKTVIDAKKARKIFDDDNKKMEERIRKKDCICAKIRAAVMVCFLKRIQKLPLKLSNRRMMEIIKNGNECAVINLDSQRNEGTHWVAYRKMGHVVNYLDSFGHLEPPKELIDYLGVRVKIT